MTNQITATVCKWDNSEAYYVCYEDSEGNWFGDNDCASKEAAMAEAKAYNDSH